MKKTGDFLGIEIGATHLKIAHVRSTGLRREVVDLIAQEIREMNDEDVAAFIKRSTASLNLKDPVVYLSVPLHAVITRSIEIPSRDPEEIKEIVNLQASRHTPYSRSEIIIDMSTLGVVRENYTKVLLVIAPRDLVTRQTKILQRAGMALKKVIFSPEGLCIAVSKILNIENSDATVAVIHMDSAYTSFLVTQRSKILYVRGISIGAEQLMNERELYAEKFVDELTKSLESYTADEAGPKISQAVLTGVLGEATDLDDLFRESLQMSIRHQTYFNTFTISAGARAVAVASKMVSFFGVVSSLLLFDKIKIDLVTEERRLELELHARAKQMLTTGVLTLIVLVFLFTTFTSKIYFKKTYLHNLIARYQHTKEEAKGLEEVFSKTQVIKDYLSGRGQSLEALTQVYDALPGDVRVVGLRYDEAERFTVRGTSRSMSSVFAFVTNLEKSSEFQNVKAKYVTARAEEGQDVQDFEISMMIEKGSGA